MEKILAPKEVLNVDTESLLGFSDAGDFSVRCIPGCMNCCCGGQGMFNNHIVGPGLVITESMPLAKLRKTLGNVRENSQSGGLAVSCCVNLSVESCCSSFLFCC